MSFEEILRDAEIRSVEGDLRRARWPIRDSDPGQRGERQHPGTELPIFRAGLFRPDAYHSDNYGYWSDDDYRLRVGTYRIL